MSSGIFSSVFIFAQIRLLANINIFKEKLQIFVVFLFGIFAYLFSFFRRDL